MRLIRPALLASTLLAGAALPATPLAPESADRLKRVGSVIGAVRTSDGIPIAGAQVVLEGTASLGTSDREGRFALDLVPAGSYVLSVTRDGYREARAEVRVVDDSVVTVSVALVSRGQRLSAVRIVETLKNHVHGVVLDPQGRPLPGVRVGFVGAHRSVLTDEDGRYSVVDLPNGLFLIEVREVGYQLARYPIQIVDRLERNVTIRLVRGRRNLSKLDVANGAIAEREAGSREGFRRRSNTVVFGREHLAPYGRVGLDFALQQLAPGLFNMRQANNACVLVDGLRPLGRSLGPPPPPTIGSSPMRQATPPRPQDQGELRRFFADRVERVEIFPVNTDDSRTLCSRFSGASGCGCSPEITNPLTIVIWERR